MQKRWRLTVFFQLLFLVDLPANVFHKYNPGIPVNAEIGVVAVFIKENIADITENSRLKDNPATVDNHKL